jgi:hypothetical protein
MANKSNEFHAADSFEVVNENDAKYRVSFVQAYPITACIIQRLSKPDSGLMGITICNPLDKWNPIEGYNKSFKRALNDAFFEYKGGLEMAVSTIFDKKPFQVAYYQFLKDMRMLK